MAKHTQTIRRLLPTNCLGVFDHFVGLALTGLTNTLLLKSFEVINRINSLNGIIAQKNEVFHKGFLQ